MSMGSGKKALQARRRKRFFHGRKHRDRPFHTARFE